MAARYQAIVDMAEYADEHGFDDGHRSRSTTAPTTGGARRRW